MMRVRRGLAGERCENALPLLDRAAFSLALAKACMAMTRRGLRVDDTLRRERLVALTTEAERLQVEARPLIESLKSKLTQPHLYWSYPVCRGCRNGKNKRLTCAQCNGMGKFETFECNLGSPHQLKDILYGALRLPKRSSQGVVTTDEEALQSLVALDSSGLVMLALRYAKLSTMAEIYERIAPAPDGHVRTVMNPAGTYTFRFSHKSAFYVAASTNLANLPNVEAKRHALYAVRDCLVPEPNEVFLEADLSAADTWSVAALSDDAGLLEMLRSRADIHSFTAANMLGIPASAVTQAQRNIVGKVTRHAGSFGEGWNSLMRRINAQADLTGLTATAAQAKTWTRNFQTLHPNLDAVWWERVEATLRRGAPMRAFTGQTCQFYPRLDDLGNPDAETVRAAVAWEPQYNTSVLAKMALLDMFQQENGSNWRVLMDSHDAVLVGVPTGRVHNAARALKRAMEREITVNGHRLTIPAEVFRCSTRLSEKERIL